MHRLTPQALHFAHPEPPKEKSRIWPVFMPFMGCPFRCMYCAQHIQTGVKRGTTLDALYRDLRQQLHSAHEDGTKPLELAFYGGTFTALPEEWVFKFLDLVNDYKEKGFLTRIRCSTRPDSVEDELLKKLQGKIDLIELGIQSFNDLTLSASGRGYTAAVAHDACDRVKAHGFALAIQLLPALPQNTEEIFAQDITETIAHSPEYVRLYPCVVLRGTALEQDYLQGKYIAWDVPQATEAIGRALLPLWKAGIRVIRIGLPQEEDLAENITVGPYHPALGQIARSKALCEYVTQQVQRFRLEFGDFPTYLKVPTRWSGEFSGYRREMLEEYKAMGLEISYNVAQKFILGREDRLLLK
ncbi:MAG: radical SAM protein [Desulfovibrio sp.]